MFGSLKTWLGRQDRMKRSTRLGMESLEAREVPACVVSLQDFDGYMIQVTGTAAGDTAEVSRNSAGDWQVKHKSGSETAYSYKTYSGSLNVQHVIFVGGGGSDWFKNATSVATTADGGAGNDTLSGGSGNDNLCGGSENDFLYGNGGRDTLYGGLGNDNLSGGDQEDTLKGEAGADTLYGGEGNDKLYGGADRDALHGQGGDDFLDVGSVPIPSSPDTADGSFGIDINAQVAVVNGVSYADVFQGGGPTCWIAAAMSSVALRNPACVQNAVKYAGENTYDVSLYNPSGQPITQRVTFDGDRVGADARFSADEGEFWMVVWQRAYVLSRGGTFYSIGAGNSMDVMTAMTGRASTFISANPTSLILADSAWTTMTSALAAGKNVTALTWGDPSLVTTGLLEAWHYYTVLNLWTDPGSGTKYVVLRNPWGTDGGTGYGDDDGVVMVSWTHFRLSMCEVDIN